MLKYNMNELKYLGFSYKNMYDTEKYNKEMSAYNYVCNEKYYRDTKISNLPDEFSLVFQILDRRKWYEVNKANDQDHSLYSNRTYPFSNSI